MKYAIPLVFALALPSLAQQGPTFEAVSVRESPPMDPQRGRLVSGTGGPGTKDPTRARFTGYSNYNLVLSAFDLRPYQVPQGAWADFRSSFEVEAVVPPNTTREDFRAMMRNMLTERFHLKTHMEKRTIEMYDLVQVKGGHKLKPGTTPVPAEPGAGGPPRMGADGFPEMPKGQDYMAYMNGRGRMQVVNGDLQRLIAQISGDKGAPVNDATGLTGKYDFTLSWVAPSMQAANPDDLGQRIDDALPDQLGLKLEKRKGEIDVLIVDAIDKTPTAN